MRSVSSGNTIRCPRAGAEGHLATARGGLDPRPWGEEQRLFLSFLRLAILALFLTGIFVLLVAIARTPLVVLVAGQGYLTTALVAHVTFALNVWLLSFIAALWAGQGIRLGIQMPRRVLRWSAILAWSGVALMAAVPLAGVGRPVLIDYVPYLDHPVFFLGIAAFGSGIALAATSYLASSWRKLRVLDPEALALAISAAGYLVGLGILGLTAVRGRAGDPEMLVWGTGHVLQLVNAAALAAGSFLLAPPIGRRAGRLVRFSFLGFVLSLGVVIGVYALDLPWETVATVFWTGVGLPSFVAWSVVLAACVSNDRRPRGRGQLQFLFLAAALFAAGGGIALLGLGNDTRVTAHYHGVVGAVTVVFMGLTYRVLESWRLRLAWSRVAAAQPYLYGGGLLMVIAGLFLAGEAGTARKVFEAISSNPSLVIPAALFGVGALVTIAGGVVFVVSVGLPLAHSPSTAQEIVRPGDSNGHVSDLVVGMPR